MMADTSIPRPVSKTYDRATRQLGAIATLAVFVSIAAAAAIVILVFVNLSNATATRVAVYRSFDARSQVQRVFSLLQDAETGQRGFLVTGDASFLAPYHKARTEIEQEVVAMRQLFAHEPSQIELMGRLEELKDRKLDDLQLSIDAAKLQGFAAARARVAEGRGKALMDQIRNVTSGLISIEASELETHTAENRHAREVFQASLFGLLILVVLTIGGAAWFIFANFKRRITVERTLRDSLARQNAIFDGTIDGIVILNESGSVETPNQAAEQLFGYHRGRMIGLDFGRLVDLHGQDEVGTAAKLRELFRLGERQEVTACSQNGNAFAAEVGLTELVVAEKRLYVAAVRDISERKRVAQLKNEFVSTVSHELRTPLTSISGSLGLVMGGAVGVLPEKATRLLDIAHKNSQRLIRLINDILDIEKIESGKMIFDLKPLQLRPLVEQVIDANAAFADSFNVSLKCEDTNADCVVSVDADRMVQVITNLVSNAIKFSPANSEVTVSITGHGQTCRLSVRDRGPGIPENFRNRIFSKFAQADASDTRAKGGTGLGLSIAWEIVNRMGGNISFETVEGEGSVFHVDLPLHAIDQEMRHARHRVLVHGTDASHAPQLRNLLKKHGVFVEVVDDRRKAHDLTSRYRFDVALVEVASEDQKGIDLIKALRADNSTKALPILAFAGSDGAKPNGLAALNVLDWVEKPISSDAMVSAIRDALTRATSDRPRVLHVDDDPDVLQIVSNALGYSAEITSVSTLTAARKTLERDAIDVVILDLSLGDASGLDLLPDLKNADGNNIPVIVFSAHDTDAQIATRVNMMLTKSRASMDSLVASVERLAHR